MSSSIGALECAKNLCKSFAQGDPIDVVLSYFSDDCLCFEHGLPELAPFLGREFCGHAGVRQYFRMIGDLLSFEGMSFRDFVHDSNAKVICVIGEAKFTWKSTGYSWDEVFTYRLQMSEGGLIDRYEVWADSGAAYLASLAKTSDS